MALPQVSLPTYELEVPSTGKKIKYRPFVVREEKLLLLALEGEDEKEIESAMKTLIKGCVQSRIKIEDLAIFDLEYIFLKIRSASVGEVVELNVTCEDDGETQVRYNLNLNDVEVSKPGDHSNKIELSDTMGLIMKYPSFKEFVSSSILEKRMGANEVIEAIAGCIDQLYDGEDVYDSSTTTKKEFCEFLEGLTNNQFEQIQKFFETTPRLEHVITITNPNTGVENKVVIAGLTSFFG
jgi:hypothetical protein